MEQHNKLPPQSDPVGILLGKVDKETNADKPLGAASLEGAQFEVTYYDVQGYGNQDAVSKDVATEIASNSTMNRSWTFKTDPDGYCTYHDDFKVSGDELYHATNGDTALPLGTVVIHEVQAPKGYLNNNEDVYWVREIRLSRDDNLLVRQPLSRSQQKLVFRLVRDMRASNNSNLISAYIPTHQQIIT